MSIKAIIARDSIVGIQAGGDHAWLFISFKNGDLETAHLQVKGEENYLSEEEFRELGEVVGEVYKAYLRELEED